MFDLIKKLKNKKSEKNLRHWNQVYKVCQSSTISLFKWAIELMRKRRNLFRPTQIVEVIPISKSEIVANHQLSTDFNLVSIKQDFRKTIIYSFVFLFDKITIYWGSAIWIQKKFFYNTCYQQAIWRAVNKHWSWDIQVQCLFGFKKSIRLRKSRHPLR